MRTLTLAGHAPSFSDVHLSQLSARVQHLLDEIGPTMETVERAELDAGDRVEVEFALSMISQSLASVLSFVMEAEATRIVVN